MSNEAVEGVPLAPTPRLVFDKPVEEPETGSEIQEPEIYRDIREPVKSETEDQVEAPASDMSEDLEVSPELDDLSVDELKKHQEEVERKIREKQEAEKRAVIDQIIDVVKTYDISVEELVDALGGMKNKRKGVKAVQKYRDPVTGATWSGRGKEPAWIRNKDRKDFLVDDTEE